MKLFALAATLATARQRRAITNEQGGSWEIQEAQVSNQVEQISNQRGQVSKQNGNVPLTCEESYAQKFSGMWYWGSHPGYQNMDTCDFVQLIRIHGYKMYDQFTKKFGFDVEVDQAWQNIDSQTGRLWTMDYDLPTNNKGQTGCGHTKIPRDENGNYDGMSGYSMECGQLCQFIKPINEKDDFKAFLDKFASIIQISFPSSMPTYIIYI